MEYTQEMKDRMKERLKKIAKKKITTTMIYPLNQFELAFGYLWGYGKEENELTSVEKQNLLRWEEVRNNILNLGNQQSRGLCSEIDMHDVVWNRYQTEFIIQGAKNES